MKRIIYLFAIGLTFATLLFSCNNFNDQFEELEDDIKITNVANYEYTLSSNDYLTISSNALKIATNATDSALARSIYTNKYFSKTIFPHEIIGQLFAPKYKYADNGSVVMLSHNFFKEYDTITISSSNKYTLLAADYDAMGTATGQPGQFDNFSSTANPKFYLPIWLKLKYPYAVSGSIKLIRYQFYTSAATTQQKLVLIHNGTDWIPYEAVTVEEAKFKLKQGIWEFIDTDILIGLNSNTQIGSNLGNFTPISVAGDQVWAWDSYGYMKMTGYVSGSYFDNEDWLVSPAMDFSERVEPILTFDHVGRYFGDTAPANEKMKIAITVWVSISSNGTTIDPTQWTSLALPDTFYPSGANWTFISSGELNLKAYKGQSNVRVAFKYLSSSANNAAGTWEVKNVYVYEKQ
jgi:hypothetical protein